MVCVKLGPPERTAIYDTISIRGRLVRAIGMPVETRTCRRLQALTGGLGGRGEDRAPASMMRHASLQTI
jgi:hypothetical protein